MFDNVNSELNYRPLKHRCHFEKDINLLNIALFDDLYIVAIWYLWYSYIGKHISTYLKPYKTKQNTQIN